MAAELQSTIRVTQTWEYKSLVVNFTGGLDGGRLLLFEDGVEVADLTSNPEGVVQPYLLKRINWLGAQGWEMTGAAAYGHVGGSTSTSYWFKRPSSPEVAAQTLAEREEEDILAKGGSRARPARRLFGRDPRAARPAASW